VSVSDILESVTDDPATEQSAANRAAVQRRRRVLAAGHGGDAAAAQRGLADPNPAVQVAALGALARRGLLRVADVTAALGSEEPAVRRRAAEAARGVRGAGSRSTLVTALLVALDDADPLVVVQAAWFLSERRVRRAVPTLATLAQTHDDMRCREAAVAALGAIGDGDGLPAVLAALDDKATVRRRATVALAGFDDPLVDEALRRSATDRDWQVRQAADELLDE
jgi:HEAT repeat protein